MPKKILIVDDDADFVEATATVLQAENFQVISACNGAEGFKRAREDKPDLILLDVMMTHKTEGFDIARSLKNDPQTSKLPVIIITGIRKEMNLPFGFEPDEEWLPVKAVLEKPIKPETLLKTVRDVLGNR